MYKSNYHNLPLFIGIILLFSSSCLMAMEKNAVQFNAQAESRSPLDNTAFADVSADAQRWGLSSEEWLRYLDIKKGPRGIWSPNIDPIAMLALEARDDTEMRYYAKLYAKMQDRRIQAELKMDRYRREAVKAMYANSAVFDQNILHPKDKKVKNSILSLANPSKTLIKGDRLLFFVDVNKTPVDLVHRVSNQIEDNQGSTLDIYVIGAKTDNAIYEWAQKSGVNGELVKQRLITLNHDGGTLKKLSDNMQKTQLFLKRKGEILRVRETSL